MSLRSFVDACEPHDATLTVHNPESESPLYRLLTTLFSEQAVTVRRRDGERAVPADTVVVERDDDAVAVSSFEATQDAIPLVNSDLYTTGTRGLDDVATPDVLTRLGEDPTVEPHLYGVPDLRPSVPGTTVHADRCEELRRSWFVVYEPTGRPDDAAALVVCRTDAGTWEGVWTYDAEIVGEVGDYLAATYHG